MRSIIFLLLLSLNNTAQELGQQITPVQLPVGPASFTALGRIVPPGCIIGVGEATHGSSEFIITKSNCFLYLHRDWGYNDFAIEIPFSVGPMLTAYINNESGKEQLDSILRPAKTLSKEDAFIALNCAAQLQCSFELSTGRQSFFAYRDKLMAAISTGIIKHINSTRIMLWGHNLHIKKNSRGIDNMGTYLTTSFREKYFAIGSVFKKGGYRVWYKGVLSQKSLPAETSGELTKLISTTDYPMALFTAADIMPFLHSTKVDIHDVGIVQMVDHPKANKATLYPFKDFDAYFYFDHISALEIPPGK